MPPAADLLPKLTLFNTAKFKKYILPNLLKRKVWVRKWEFGSVIICHLSKRWNATFFILCEVIFLVSCRRNLKLITLGSERVKDFSGSVIPTKKGVAYCYSIQPYLRRCYHRVNSFAVALPTLCSFRRSLRFCFVLSLSDDCNKSTTMPRVNI